MAPKFTILDKMGVKGSPDLPQLETDLLVLTAVAGSELGRTPTKYDQSLGGLLRRTVNQRKFRGECGKSIHINVDPDVHDLPQKHVLLVGIGSCQEFSYQAACKVFTKLIDRALKLGVEKVTIPFPSNRATGSTLNLKGTAHCLRQIVEEKTANLDKNCPLKEIVIFCTPQARKHIQQGLNAPLHSNGHCCCY